jgi:hypothetical protein
MSTLSETVCLEWWIEVDEIDRLGGYVLTEDVEIVAAVQGLGTARRY